MPKRVNALAKKELIYAGSFGIAGWLCGGLVFVDRLNSEKAQGTLRKLAKLIKSKNVSRMVKYYYLQTCDSEIQELFQLINIVFCS